MDSLSQIALGASLGHLTLGARLGRSALLLGAALGTVPDLDVLIRYDDAISNFTYHRGFSHSLFVLTLFSFPVAWACQRFWHSKTAIPYSRWWLGCWLVLFTHPILDAFTVYGTQLFWPLTTPPVAWGSIFIIDPLYTLPLLLGIVAAYRMPFTASKPLVIASLSISSCYLAWTLFAQTHVRQLAEDNLRDAHIEANRILIAPFPFSLLWRVVVLTDSHYLEGYSSLLDTSKSLHLDRYNNGTLECASWLDHPPIQRLDWFTQGMFSLSIGNNQLIASDLRMGVEDDYVFEFELAEWDDTRWQAVKTRRRPVDIDKQRMLSLFRRIIDPDVNLSPQNNTLRTVTYNCEPALLQKSD